MLCPGWLAGEVVTVTVACITTIIQISSHRAVIKPAPASSGLGWAGLGSWCSTLPFSILCLKRRFAITEKDPT